jgi:hypothetical protein
MIMIRCFLCTVGSVYIKSKEALAKDVLKYLVEMCCGIQNLAPVKHHFHIISAIVKVLPFLFNYSFCYLRLECFINQLLIYMVPLLFIYVIIFRLSSRV